MPLNRLSAIGKRNWPDLLLALALAASLPGCLLPDRTGNEITYYNIEPEPPKAPDRTPADLSLAVRAFDSASRYQERILIRGDGLTVSYLEYERWVESPAEMVTRAVRRGLAGACVTCVVADDRLVRRADVFVEGRLTCFDQVRQKTQWSAACEIELVVKVAERDRALLARRIAVTRPAKAQTTAAFVEAMNAAVADLAAQAADAVDKALADYAAQKAP